MLVEMIDELDHAVLLGAAHRHVVEHGKVLHIFAQPDPAAVRTDGDTESRGQQDD